MGRAVISTGRLRPCPRAVWAYPLGGNVCDLEVERAAVPDATRCLFLLGNIEQHEATLKLASSRFEQRNQLVAKLMRLLGGFPETVSLDAVNLCVLRPAHVVAALASAIIQPNGWHRCALKVQAPVNRRSRRRAALDASAEGCLHLGPLCKLLGVAFRGLLDLAAKLDLDNV